MRNAFTLIELLVVMAIIGILASLVLGAIGPVRDMAYRTMCANQMRQCGLAMTAYRNDWDDYFPPPVVNNSWWNWQTAPLNEGRWPHFLETYTESYRVFNCPVSSRLQPDLVMSDRSDGSRGTANAGAVCLTGYNAVNIGRTPDPSSLRGPLTAAACAQAITANAPGSSLGQSPVLTDGVLATNYTYISLNSFGSYFPHRGRMTAVFIDGRIATLVPFDFLPNANALVVR